MLNALYYIIISPIELLIESAFEFLSTVVRHNYGFSILGISALVTLLCLPLYAKAELLQKKERDIQEKMSKRISSIKKHFKGDERYMILSMYYRENHYHPLMALRSSLSLLIQIPFFIAAYSFLSHYPGFRGASLLFIRDLGSPDGLLHLGAISINLLPVIMTMINIISGAVYTKGFSLKEKLQLYGMAVIFLILLYNSPAALVLYWTFNNIFSLIKNIVYKFKNPKKILYLGVLGVLLAGCLYVLFFRRQSMSMSFLFKALALIASALIAGIPLYIKFANYFGRRFFSNLKTKSKELRGLFFAACLAAWVLCGIVIPFNVVSSDPAAFSFLMENPSPFAVVYPVIFIALGLFVFWPVYLFLIFSDKTKVVFSFLMVLLVILGLLNAFLFFGSYGTLSTTLTFSSDANFFGTLRSQIINLLISVFIISIILLALKKEKIQMLSAVMVIFFISGSVMGIWKTTVIQREYAAYRAIVAQEKNRDAALPTASEEQIAPVFNLSKTEKNVVVLMLDRAVGSYLPLIFEDREELKSAFSGFTYYPNTVSFFRATNLGLLPVLGGYEYTPERLHDRKSELMVDKTDEALLVLPSLFAESGYNAHVFDMPLVNFQSGLNTSFFTDRGIAAESLEGKYTGAFLKELGDHAPENEIDYDTVFRRNFLMFSIFSISPPALRTAIYDKGTYWSATDTNREDIVKGYTLNTYSTLYYLPQLTGAAQDAGSFVVMVNNLTHAPSFLQYPDYSVVREITDFGPDHFSGNVNSFQHYHVNAASYILLASWFDYLREQDLYDNTRIIIVSDHDEMLVKPLFSDALNKINTYYNPILLVKDFDAAGDLTTDMSFMTNADAALLAIQDIITDPKNPFTGNALKPDKENGVNIFLDGSYQTRDYPGYEALEKNSTFYHVKDNIFVEDNWTKFSRRYPD